MKDSRLCLILFFFVVVSFLSSNCFSADLDYSKWHIKKEKKQYLYLTEKDREKLTAKGERPPLAPAPFPCAKDRPFCWESPEEWERKEYKGYTFTVHEYGYKFLETTKNPDYDEVAWAWRLVVENNTKHPVDAFAYCELLDKDDFVLTTNFMRNLPGTLVSAGTKATVQNKEYWKVDRNTKPYPPTRVAKVKCSLLVHNQDLELGQ